ncbi:UNVERIFIED_CONTAM: hypothetical protein K2H54_003944 [Gekko kuhli]
MNFQAGPGQSPGQQQQSLAAPGPSGPQAGGAPQPQFGLSNSAAIRAEIGRFESVHPNIYAIYDLIERVEDLALQSQIREHVISIEGGMALRQAFAAAILKNSPPKEEDSIECSGSMVDSEG